jgi:hypothetical protein
MANLRRKHGACDGAPVLVAHGQITTSSSETPEDGDIEEEDMDDEFGEDTIAQRRRSKGKSRQQDDGAESENTGADAFTQQRRPNENSQQQVVVESQGAVKDAFTQRRSSRERSRQQVDVGPDDAREDHRRRSWRNSRQKDDAESDDVHEDESAQWRCPRRKMWQRNLEDEETDARSDDNASKRRFQGKSSRRPQQQVSYEVTQLLEALLQAAGQRGAKPRQPAMRRRRGPKPKLSDEVQTMKDNETSAVRMLFLVRELI